jgi:hypothetical protein
MQRRERAVCVAKDGLPGGGARQTFRFCSKADFHGAVTLAFADIPSPDGACVIAVLTIS